MKKKIQINPCHMSLSVHAVFMSLLNLFYSFSRVCKHNMMECCRFCIAVKNCHALLVVISRFV